MKPALLILGAFGGYLAYKVGERRAFQTARIVVGLVDEGLATVSEDGTVVMVESFEDSQREVAHLQ